MMEIGGVETWKDKSLRPLISSQILLRSSQVGFRLWHMICLPTQNITSVQVIWVPTAHSISRSISIWTNFLKCLKLIVKLVMKLDNQLIPILLMTPLISYLCRQPLSLEFNRTPRLSSKQEDLFGKLINLLLPWVTLVLLMFLMEFARLWEEMAVMELFQVQT